MHFDTFSHFVPAEEDEVVADDMFTNDNEIPSLYSWRINGYSECSTSCDEGRRVNTE